MVQLTALIDYFSNTVALLIKHNTEGAFQLLLNKPIDVVWIELPKDKAFVSLINKEIIESGAEGQDRLCFINIINSALEVYIRVISNIALTNHLEIIEGRPLGLFLLRWATQVGSMRASGAKFEPINGCVLKPNATQLSARIRNNLRKH